MRLSAKDASSRLRAVTRQRSELATLLNRQSYERQMMRGLHAGERARLKERHSAARALERAGAVPVEFAEKVEA
jgi:hypothetical protein